MYVSTGEKWRSTRRPLASLLAVDPARQEAGDVDVLTGLASRAAFVARARETAAPSAGRRTVVLVVGLDRFSLLGDSIGDAGRAQVVIEIASRLAKVFQGELLARTAEGELAVLLELHRDEAETVWSHVVEQLSRPIARAGGDLAPAISGGFAFGRDAGTDAQTLLEDATAVMHRAQARGSGTFDVFQETLRTDARRRLELEGELRLAIERRELEVHYQPIVDVQTGDVRGLEALVRWTHSVHGRVPPDRFIPIAEEQGWIGDVGLFVLEEIVRQKAAWDRAGGPLRGISVSLNTSARQLEDERLSNALHEAVASGRLRPEELWIEITESALVADASIERLGKLRALGFRLALDDFGAGYSSLLQLQRLPLDAVKIDRAFLRDLATDARAASMLEAICWLAKSLSLCVVPEGVETRDQLRALRALDCKAAQGFLWSPALAAKDLERWLATRERRSE